MGVKPHQMPFAISIHQFGSLKGSLVVHMAGDSVLGASLWQRDQRPGKTRQSRGPGRSSADAGCSERSTCPDSLRGSSTSRVTLNWWIGLVWGLEALVHALTTKPPTHRNWTSIQVRFHPSLASFLWIRLISTPWFLAEVYCPTNSHGTQKAAICRGSSF